MLRKERLVMRLLSEQGHQNVPYAHSLDLTSASHKPACMQDIHGQVTSHYERIGNIKRRVAYALSRIHLQNMGRDRLPGWLPSLDLTAFMSSWRSSWKEALSNPCFEREFNVYTQQLEHAAQRFIDAMTAFRKEEKYITLIHGDMLPPEFDHVVIYKGKPFFIDWGNAQAETFYLDLPNYFETSEALFYRDLLVREGLDISKSDFIDRYLEAGRYVGFKYLNAGLTRWSPGPTKYRGKLLLVALRMAIDGTIPQVSFSAKGKLWHSLLNEHRETINRSRNF